MTGVYFLLLGFRTFWIASLSICILPDLTSGLECLACNGVLHVQDCTNVTDCTVSSEICFIQETSDGYKLGCMSKRICDILAHATMKNLCADCCENEALCNSKLCGLNVTTTYQTHPLPSTTPVTTSSVTQSTVTTTITQPKVTTTIAQPKVTTTSITNSSVTTTTTATTTELILAPPVINGTISLAVHGNGRLDCVSGRNDVNFTWQFNGTSSIPQHVHVFGNHLLIVSMTEAEVGMYTCIISNLGTTAHASTWLSMNAVYTTLPTSTLSSLLPPHISGQTLINLNADTILACNSDEPGVTYTWLYQGNKTLPPGVAIFAGSHLVIVGANSSNVGTFACVIDKNGNQAVTYITVTIIPKRRKALMVGARTMLCSEGWARTMLCSEGWARTMLSRNGCEKPHVAFVVASPNHPWTHHRVDIHCSVTGYPDPDIYWSFTDTMGLSYVPINVSYPDRATVRIDDFEPSLHSGKWSCIARNIIGVDNDFVQI